jgi:hypothetical protein
MEFVNAKIRLITRVAFGFSSPDALIALAMAPHLVGTRSKADCTADSLATSSAILDRSTPVKLSEQRWQMQQSGPSVPG